MDFVIAASMVLVPISLLIIGHVLEKHLKLLNRRLELLADKLERTVGQ